MVKILQWSLCFYLALKLIQYFFVARPGFRQPEPGFREKIRRGEPVVFLVACAVAVPAALLSSWYLHRGYERGFEHSADCHGKLGALISLPDVQIVRDASRIHRSAQAAEKAALFAAGPLRLAPAAVREVLDGKVQFYRVRYSGLSRDGDRARMREEAGAIERCMNEPLISF